MSDLCDCSAEHEVDVECVNCGTGYCKECKEDQCRMCAICNDVICWMCPETGRGEACHDGECEICHRTVCGECASMEDRPDGSYLTICKDCTQNQSDVHPILEKVYDACNAYEVNLGKKIIKIQRKFEHLRDTVNRQNDPRLQPEESLWGHLVARNLIGNKRDEWLDADSYILDAASNPDSQMEARAADFLKNTMFGAEKLYDHYKGSISGDQIQLILSNLEVSQDALRILDQMAAERKRPKKRKNSWDSDEQNLILAHAHKVLGIIGRCKLK